MKGPVCDLWMYVACVWPVCGLCVACGLCVCGVCRVGDPCVTCVLQVCAPCVVCVCGCGWLCVRGSTFSGATSSSSFLRFFLAFLTIESKLVRVYTLFLKREEEEEYRRLPEAVSIFWSKSNTDHPRSACASMHWQAEIRICGNICRHIDTYVDILWGCVEGCKCVSTLLVYMSTND
jgi:hypothetical protein